MTDKATMIQAAIEDSERTRDAVPPPGTRGVRKNREPASVYSVRLPDRIIAELMALADAQDVPVAAVVRGFIIDGLLKHDGGNLSAALDRLERDVDEVRRRAVTG